MTGVIEMIDPVTGEIIVASHEHGTALSGFLPSSWDHLGCQLWDHRARLAGGCAVRSLTRHVIFCDVAVTSRSPGPVMSLPLARTSTSNAAGPLPRHPPPVSPDPACRNAR